MKKVYTLLTMLLCSTFMFAQVEGKWQVAPEAMALAVGPALGSSEWWFNTAEDVSTRDCFFDDEYIFEADGTFRNVVGDMTWLETWQGVSEDGCGVPVAPHDGSNAATWAYDAAAGTITLTGVGAFLGLPKVFDGGEITSPADAKESITYPVSLDGDNMVIDISIGGGFWRFNMVRTGSTSTTDIVNDQFSYYPNPATSELYVEFEKPVDVLLIRDIAGSIVYQNNNVSMYETVDVADMAPGMYLVESKADDQMMIQKLIIQ